MGRYINPESGTKEAWIYANCIERNSATPTSWPPSESDIAYVCLSYNPRFTSAAILFNRREFDEFAGPHHMTYKEWHKVPKIRLIEAGFVDEEDFDY